MKIYISGAQATGKTTLVEWVADRYNLTKLPEVALEIVEDWNMPLSHIRRNKQLLVDFQEEIYRAHRHNELREVDNFVSDRSIIDNYAYTSEYTPELLDRMYPDTYMFKRMKQDSIIFLLTPHRELIEKRKEQRPWYKGIDWDKYYNEMQRLHGILRFIHNAHSFDYIEITRLDIDVRKDLISRYIERRWGITPRR